MVSRPPPQPSPNSPLSARNERGGAGGGAPPRTQPNPLRRSQIQRNPQPPPVFFGGGGRGLRARWGRQRAPVQCPSTSPEVPHPRPHVVKYPGTPYIPAATQI